MERKSYYHNYDNHISSILLDNGCEISSFYLESEDGWNGGEIFIFIRESQEFWEVTLQNKKYNISIFLPETKRWRYNIDPSTFLGYVETETPEALTWALFNIDCFSNPK